MKPAVLAAVLALAAGAARAETPEALRAAVYRAPAAPSVGFSLPAPPEPARPAGVAKTSIDHRFAREGLDGSLGFLCGLQPAASGAMAATGVDPHGRFLGVKLHMSFR
jgi:hypothetical protein